MRAVVLTLALLVTYVAALPKWHQLEGYTFEQYLRETRKGYAPGSDVYKKRESIFNARLKDIRAHNADPTKTWKRGVNQFADWTAEEFAKYNRARLPAKDLPLKNKNVKEFKATRDVSQLPRYVDYRNNVNPPVLTGIKNQGSCGSCWAHSATESLESYFALKYGQLPVLSTQQITSCTEMCGGCGGGSFVAGWDYVSQNGGLNEEWTYPYTNFFAKEMSWSVTHKCQNITKLFPNISTGADSSFIFTWWPKTNVTGWTRVKANDANAMMEALATVGPQSISVAASSQWSDYESGVLVNNYSTIATNYSWQEINHDVQIVGYGHDLDLDMNYWIVRNSWGTNYGEQGFIRLSRPKVEPCGNLTGGTICGTSGVLCNPGYPEVSTLEPENGYYF